MMNSEAGRTQGMYGRKENAHRVLASKHEGK